MRRQHVPLLLWRVLEDKCSAIHVEMRELMRMRITGNNCNDIVVSQELWRRVNFGQLLLQTTTEMFNRFLTLFLLLEPHDLLFVRLGQVDVFAYAHIVGAS